MGTSGSGVMSPTSQMSSSSTKIEGMMPSLRELANSMSPTHASSMKAESPSLRGLASKKIRKFPTLAPPSIGSVSTASSFVSRKSRKSWTKPSGRNNHNNGYDGGRDDVETPRRRAGSRRGGGYDFEERDYNRTGGMAHVSPVSSHASSRGSRGSGNQRPFWGERGGTRHKRPSRLDQEDEGRDDVETMQREGDDEERDNTTGMSTTAKQRGLSRHNRDKDLKASSQDTHATNETSVSTVASLVASISERDTPFDESSDDGSAAAPPVEEEKGKVKGADFFTSSTNCMDRQILLPSRSDLREVIAITTRIEFKDTLLGACKRDDSVMEDFCGRRCPSDEAPSFGDNLSILDSGSWGTEGSSSLEGGNDGLNSPTSQKMVEPFDEPKKRRELKSVKPTSSSVFAEQQQATNRKGRESFEIITNYTDTIGTSSMLVELGHQASQTRDDDEDAENAPPKQWSQSPSDKVVSAKEHPVPQQANSRLQTTSTQEADLQVTPPASTEEGNGAEATTTDLRGSSLSQDSKSSFIVHGQELVLPYKSIDDADLSITANISNIDLPSDKDIFFSVNEMVGAKQKTHYQEPQGAQDPKGVQESSGTTREDLSSIEAGDSSMTETKEKPMENQVLNSFLDGPLRSLTSKSSTEDLLLIDLRSTNPSHSIDSKNPSRDEVMDTPDIQQETQDFLDKDERISETHTTQSTDSSHQKDSSSKPTIAISPLECPGSPSILSEPQKLGDKAIYSFYRSTPAVATSTEACIVQDTTLQEPITTESEGSTPYGNLTIQEKDESKMSGPEDERGIKSQASDGGDSSSSVDELIRQWVCDGSNTDNKQQASEGKRLLAEPDSVSEWGNTPRYLELPYKEGSKSGRSEMYTVSSLGDPDIGPIVMGNRGWSNGKISEESAVEDLLSPWDSHFHSIGSPRELPNNGERSAAIGSEPHPSLEDTTRGQRLLESLENTRTVEPLAALDDPDIGQIVIGSRPRDAAKSGTGKQHKDPEEQSHPSLETSLGPQTHPSLEAGVDAGKPGYKPGDSDDDKVRTMTANEKTGSENSMSSPAPSEKEISDKSVQKIPDSQMKKSVGAKTDASREEPGNGLGKPEAQTETLSNQNNIYPAEEVHTTKDEGFVSSLDEDDATSATGKLKKSKPTAANKSKTTSAKDPSKKVWSFYDSERQQSGEPNEIQKQEDQMKDPRDSLGTEKDQHQPGPIEDLVKIQNPQHIQNQEDPQVFFEMEERERPGESIESKKAQHQSEQSEELVEDHPQKQEKKIFSFYQPETIVEKQEERISAKENIEKGIESQFPSQEITRTDSGDSTLEGSEHIGVMEGFETKAIKSEAGRPAIPMELVVEEPEDNSKPTEKISSENQFGGEFRERGDGLSLPKKSTVCHGLVYAPSAPSLDEGLSLDEEGNIIITKNSDAPSLDEAIAGKSAPPRQQQVKTVTAKKSTKAGILPPPRQRAKTEISPTPIERKEARLTAAQQPRKLNLKERKKVGRSGENRDESGKHLTPHRIKESAIEEIPSSYIATKRRPLSASKTTLKSGGTGTEQSGNDEITEAPSMDEGHQHTFQRTDSDSVNESSIDGFQTKDKNPKVTCMPCLEQTLPVENGDLEDLIESTHELISTGEWVESPRDDSSITSRSRMDREPATKDEENATSQKVGNEGFTYSHLIASNYNLQNNNSASHKSSSSSDFTFSHLMNSSSEKTSGHARTADDEGYLPNPKATSANMESRGKGDIKRKTNPGDFSPEQPDPNHEMKSSEALNTSTQPNINNEVNQDDWVTVSEHQGQRDLAKVTAQDQKSVGVDGYSTDGEDGGASLDSSIMSECGERAKATPANVEDNLQTYDTHMSRKADYISAAKTAARYGFFSRSERAAASPPVLEENHFKSSPPSQIEVSSSKRVMVAPPPPADLEENHSTSSNCSKKSQLLQVEAAESKGESSAKSNGGSSVPSASGLKNQTVPDHAIAEVVNLMDTFKKEQKKNIAICSPEPSPRQAELPLRRSSPRVFGKSSRNDLGKEAGKESDHLNFQHQRSEDDDYFSATSQIDRYASTDEYEHIDKYYSIDCGDDDDDDFLVAKGFAAARGIYPHLKVTSRGLQGKRTPLPKGVDNVASFDQPSWDGSYLVHLSAVKSSAAPSLETSLVSTTVQSKFFPGSGSSVSKSNSFSTRSRNSLASGASRAMRSVTRSLGFEEAALSTFDDTNVPSMLTSHSSTDFCSSSSSSSGFSPSASTRSTFASKPKAILAPGPISKSFQPRSPRGYNNQILSANGKHVHQNKSQSRDSSTKPNTSTEQNSSKEEDPTVVIGSGALKSVGSIIYNKDYDDSVHRYALEPYARKGWLLQCAGGGLTQCLGGNNCTSGQPTPGG